MFVKKLSSNSKQPIKLKRRDSMSIGCFNQCSSRATEQCSIAQLLIESLQTINMGFKKNTNEGMFYS